MQQIKDVGFSTQEIEKIVRIKDMFETDSMVEEDQFLNDRKDFLNFIKEYEKRRGYKCEEYFPELIYHSWKNFLSYLYLLFFTSLIPIYFLLHYLTLHHQITQYRTVCHYILSFRVLNNHTKLRRAATIQDLTVPYDIKKSHNSKFYFQKMTKYSKEFHLWFFLLF